MAQTWIQTHDTRLEESHSNIQTSSADSLKNTLTLIDDKVKKPLKISVSGAVLSVAASKFQHIKSSGLETTSNSNQEAISPINGTVIETSISTVDVSAGSVSGNFTTSPLCPSMTASYFIYMGIELRKDGVFYPVWGVQGATSGAATLPTFTSGSLAVGYILLQDDGSAGQWNFSNPVEANVVQFSVGGGAGSADGGGQGADLATINYYVQVSDSLTDDSLVDSSYSTGTLDSGNGKYTVAYDATKTLTVATNNVTIPSGCAFTVQVGDIVKTVGGLKHTRITTVTSQTDFDVEDGSVLTTGTLGLFSQVYQSKEHIDFSDLDAQIPDYASEKFEECLVTYLDSAVEQLGTDADLAYSVCTNSTFNTPTNWINDTIRPDGLFEEVSPVAIPVAIAGNKMRVRFFANKASGTGTVSLEEFNVYYLPRSNNGGFVIASMAGKCVYPAKTWTLSGTGSVPTVNSQPTYLEVYLGFPVDRYRSEDTATSQLNIFIDGSKVHQALTSIIDDDFRYEFVDSSTIRISPNPVESMSQSFRLVCEVYDAGSVDVANVSERIGIIEELNMDWLPGTTETYDLGSTSKRWKDLWLKGTSIHLGNSTIRTNPTTGKIEGRTTDSDPYGPLGGLNYTEVTSDTNMAVNNAYVVNKASTACTLTLPPTSAIGDIISIVGKSDNGWIIKSNASATSQRIKKEGYTTNVSSSNAITLVMSMNAADSLTLICTVANDTWTMVNSQGSMIGSNWYGTGADGDVVISTNTNLVVPSKSGSYDGDMVVKNYKSLIVNSSCTLTTDQACRGLLIYVNGNCTINGTISMTNKGAYANPTVSGASDAHAVPTTGIKLRRFKYGQTTSNSDTDRMWGCGNDAVTAELHQYPLISNGKVYTIARAGAAGGTGASSYNGGAGVGGAGSSGSTGQSGGGGGGAADSGVGVWSYGGAGAAGTCFAGGPGGGANVGSGSAGAGTANGGPGGNGHNTVGGGYPDGGGAGNPGGTGTVAGGIGCGGLVILIVRGTLTIGATGVIEAKGRNGTTGCTAAGGASGGGNVLLLYGTGYSNSGTVSAAGGAQGTAGPSGAGGAGSVQTDQIDL